jgi:hypothetical protein
MTSSNTAIRTAIIYAVILPLALWVGYLLADLGTFNKLFVGMIIFSLSLPILLKWHHPVLFLVWNMTAMLGFLPGAPPVWMLVAVTSLTISILQRTLTAEMKFISVPSLTLPIIFLLLVVLFTARQTGFSVRALGGLTGSQSVGGKGYFWILGGVAGFFAMIAHRIPAEKVRLYLALFFLGGLTNAIGSAYPFSPPQLYYLFYVFPVDSLGRMPSLYQESIDRFYGVTLAFVGVFLYLLARHGIAQTLRWSRAGRGFLILAVLGLIALGGYRSFLILMVLTFLLLFYFEGLLRTQYAVILASIAILGGVALIPLASKLPLGVQRTLSILPLDVNPVARYDAQKSNEWRLEIWKSALPDVWKYLWLGKGLQISGVDLDMTAELVKRGYLSSQEEAILTGNYHSGPLTVMISFGVWGGIAWLWFLGAGVRALYRNYRYGEPSLRTINTFLLAYLVARTIHFFTIFGDLRTDFPIFVGIIGLAVAINHGIKNPASAPRAVAKPAAYRSRATLARAGA